MRVNIYIRNEDQEQWNAIVNKPEFIHNALRDLSPSKLSMTVKEVIGAAQQLVSSDLRHTKVCKKHGIETFYCKNMKH